MKDELGISEMYTTYYRLNSGVGVNITKFLNDLKHVCCFIPSYQQIFSGYDYQLVNEVNDVRIHLWLIHIREILTNNDEDVYKFTINWFAYILQNIGEKNL